MRHSTKRKVSKLARAGAFTIAEARQIGLSPRTLQNLIEAGEVTRLSRGVYQVTDIVNAPSPEYAVISKRVPSGVICLISALYHHELTTEIPRTVHVAIPRNDPVPRIDYPAVRFFRMSPRPFEAGIERVTVGRVSIRIYSPEKTIADAFKYRNTFGLDLGIEALKAFLSRRGSRPGKVLEMAKICRVAKIIRPYMEALL